MLIDLHCHLEMLDDLPGAIERAKACGVSIIICNGVNPETNRKALEFQLKYPMVRAAMGLYPYDALKREGNFMDYDADSELGFIEKNKDRIVAIGEVGLDYFNGEDAPLQKEHFRKVIELAKRIDKPIIVHSRKAEEDVIGIIEEARAKKVVLHCFSGKKGLIRKALELGCHFTVPTNVVRAENFWSLVKIVPISRLFCETDSPWLSPFRGKKNEPSFVIESYKKIAELKGLTLEETGKLIYQNFQQVFM